MSLAALGTKRQTIVAAKPKRPRFRRDFSQEYRLTSRSLPEICEKVKHVVTRLGSSKRVLFRERKLTNEAFINAAALYLCEMSSDLQESVLNTYVARIEAMMDDDSPLS